MRANRPISLAWRQPPNKQLERTVIRRHVRAASAPLHYALAARWTAQRAAAQLRRYAAQMWHLEAETAMVANAVVEKRLGGNRDA
jgi:hypothetical protein